jgi:hypothetical protein
MHRILLQNFLIEFSPSTACNWHRNVHSLFVKRWTRKKSIYGEVTKENRLLGCIFFLLRFQKHIFDKEAFHLENSAWSSFTDKDFPDWFYHKFIIHQGV